MQWAIFVATCDIHCFVCRTLKSFQGKTPSLLAISKICDYIWAIYNTNLNTVARTPNFSRQTLNVKRTNAKPLNAKRYTLNAKR